MFRMFASGIFFFALFIGQAVACPDCLQQVENIQSPPSSWSQSRPASPDHVFQLSIALNRGSHIGEALYKVSTPGHPQYGKHLSQAEAQKLLRPDAESHQQILTWLAQNKIPGSDINDQSHWIRFNTTVAKANSMLAARFTWYHNAENGMEVLRTLRYSVPQLLHKKISLVSPTTRFCDMKGMQSPLEHHELKRRNVMPITPERPTMRIESRATVDTTCNRTITPTCLRALYNVPSNITMSRARGVGVYASQNQVAKFTDFDLFIKNVAPESLGSNFSFISINGGVTDQATADSDDETNFDVEYSAALSFPVPNVIFSIGGQGPIQPELGNAPGDGTEPWLQWLDAILAMPNEMLPHTITTSFGENEQALPDGYVQQVCNQFGALGARGVSFIAASGDSGPGSTCTDNTGNVTKFQAIFPGSCPFVTATGGTKGVNPEVAVPFASGGFSEKFARPVYQDQAVPAYLNTLGNQFNGLFNAEGRGFPDVSAQSFNISFVDNALKKGFAGTSAASPIWAGLIGQVNAVLIAQNKAPLGFLNPWLYSAGMAGLTDVVLGGSIGCTGSNIFTGQQFSPALGPKIVPNAGWNATSGWDPVTGLGTPNIERLLSIAMSNATAQPTRH